MRGVPEQLGGEAFRLRQHGLGPAARGHGSGGGGGGSGIGAWRAAEMLMSKKIKNLPRSHLGPGERSTSLAKRPKQLRRHRT